ncbi:MAG: hypothetical protein IJD82_08850, partial [Clostridia bacterium]|nr:hypothetical protein [Clostridia bacterium]
MNFFDTLDERETALLLGESMEQEPLDAETLARLQASVSNRLHDKHKKRVRRRIRVALIAAALLAAAIGITVEAKEYSDAVEFFEEYNLPTDGLSRAEIKAVYRDITTETFSYSKTAEVLERRINQALLEGNELSGETPAPSDIEDLWNTLHRWKYIDGDGNAFLTSPEETVGVRYFGDREEIKRYENGKEVWGVKTPEGGYLVGFTPVSDGVVVMYSMGYGEPDRLIKVSDHGEVLWNVGVDNGFSSDEELLTVIEDADGTYAVFGRGNLDFLCLSRFDKNGNQLSFVSAELTGRAIKDAVRISDGYLVLLSNYHEGHRSELVRMDREGNITDSFFSYSSDTEYYWLTDMIEYNGRIYLSAYATPKTEDEGGRDEVAEIIDKCFEEKLWQEDNITDLVRGNYTAVLLVCDTQDY